MTLVVRDEADVLDSQLLFHLNAGVDLVLVMDEGLAADTTDLVERLEREGRVRRLPTLAGEPRSELRLRMARVAETEHGADWVIPADAGEFWWPHGGSLAQLLSETPSRYDLVQALVRPFPPVGHAEEAFEERIYRLSAQAQIGDPRNPFRPFRKYAHRATAHVADGSQVVGGSTVRPLRGWYPIDVLWFPYCSRERLALDFACTDEDYAALTLGPGEIEKGLEQGAVQVDTRLRDALRSLRAGSEFEFPRPTVVESAILAVDAAVFGEGEVVGTQQRLDELERRLAAIEANMGIRLERKLRSLIERDRGAP